MDKEQLLHDLKTASEEGLVTKNEILAALEPEDTSIPSPATGLHAEVGLTEVLYFVGGGVVCVGVGVLIAENWSALGFPLRLLSTLGLSLLAYVAALSLRHKPKLESLSEALFLISAAVLPIGIVVALNNSDLGSEPTMQTIVAGLPMVFFLVSYLALKRTSFLLYTILFGSWLYFALTDILLGNQSIFDSYAGERFFLLGIIYIVLSFAMIPLRAAALSPSLLSMGALISLGASYALQYGENGTSVLWEMVNFLCIIGAIFGSVYVKLRTLLGLGAVFLMAFIIKITGDYFTSSLGWPVSLMIAGAALMGVGYLTFYINSNYLKAKL